MHQPAAGCYAEGRRHRLVIAAVGLCFCRLPIISMDEWEIALIFTCARRLFKHTNIFCYNPRHLRSTCDWPVFNGRGQCLQKVRVRTQHICLHRQCPITIGYNRKHIEKHIETHAVACANTLDVPPACDFLGIFGMIT